MFLYSPNHPYSMYIFQAALGWLSLKERTWMGSWGWLMVSVWRGPVQCRSGRLEPLFTQPLGPDWEALFSHPGAFQRKPPAEAPRLRYTTLKTIHTASFLLSCCMLQLHTHYNNTESQYGTSRRERYVVFVSNLKGIFSSAHMDSECTIANALYFLSRHYSLQGNLASLCVLFGWGSLKNWYSSGW